MVIDFHDLYQTYAQDIYRFAYWLCGDAQEADDITSETFVRALTSADEIRTETVKGYLLTIARNLAFKHHRHRQRLTDLSPTLSAPDNGPEQAAETRSNLQATLNFLQTLPEVDRAALLMHSQEDLPYTEIAAALGISVAAARVKVHRARLKLTEYRLKTEEAAL